MKRLSLVTLLLLAGAPFAEPLEIGLAAALEIGFAPSQEPGSAAMLVAAADAGPKTDTDAYDRGTQALDDDDWDAAASAFSEVARAGGSRADGALYWLAYARHKQGRSDEALTLLRDLASRFPKSSWRKDARALELEIRPASGGAVLREGSDDEDLKLMAINGLLSTDPERAIPLLEKVLNGNASAKLKERALFVLAQSGSPRAREILAGVARGKSGPDLQEKAIHSLGVFGGRGSGNLLEEIYASNASVEIKEKVLHAFMVSGNRERILAAARGEKNPELRTSAIHWLGVMGARAELWQMYGADAAAASRRAIIHAMSISGDLDHLLEIAKSEPCPAIRREAIEKLGIMGRDRAGTALVAIYRGERDGDLRRAALRGLFIQNNARALVEIARAEKDPGLRAEAVQNLSLMHNKEATDYLLEILNR